MQTAEGAAASGMLLPELAVFDELPMFRLGVLAAAGRGGTDLHDVEALAAWARSRRGVLLYTVRDEGGEVPAELLGQGRIHVIAVLETYTVARAARALRAGAAHVVARTASAAELRRVVEEVFSGQVMLSRQVLQALTATPRETGLPVEVTDEELGWLRNLTAGSGVSALASDANMSERAMYRRLRDLYRRLGVENRTQALIRARDQGWI